MQRGWGGDKYDVSAGSQAVPVSPDTVTFVKRWKARTVLDRKWSTLSVHKRKDVDYVSRILSFHIRKAALWRNFD